MFVFHSPNTFPAPTEEEERKALLTKLLSSSEIWNDLNTFFKSSNYVGKFVSSFVNSFLVLF